MQKLGGQLLDLRGRQLTIEQVKLLGSVGIAPRPHRDKILTHDSSVCRRPGLAKPGETRERYGARSAPPHRPIYSIVIACPFALAPSELASRSATAATSAGAIMRDWPDSARILA